MSPPPSPKHQGLGGAVFAWILRCWQERGRGEVYYECGVARAGIGAWREDYRVPDLVLVKPERYARDVETHFDGGPNVVVEIHSAGDESYDKLSFYFAADVEEVWIIHRDTRVPELFARGETGFVPTRPDDDGWIVSRATSIAMRSAPHEKLALRLVDDPASEAIVPSERRR